MPVMIKRWEVRADIVRQTHQECGWVIIRSLAWTLRWDHMASISITEHSVKKR